MATLMNKGELARHLGCSLPTLAAKIARHPDFPVRQRGTKGREWQFDPDDVAAFLQRMEEAATQARAQRRRELDAMRSPLTALGVGAGHRPAGGARSDRQGFLFGGAAPESPRHPAQLGRALDELAGTFGRAHALPATVVDDLRARLAAAITAGNSAGS